MRVHKSLIKDESGAEVVLPRITHIMEAKNIWIRRQEKKLTYYEKAVCLVLMDYFDLEMEVIEQTMAYMTLNDMGLASVVEILSEPRHYVYSETYPGD
mgnify:FL=1